MIKLSPDFRPFWRAEPLTLGEVDLLNALMAAHDSCARRNNVSTWVACNAALSSGRYENAIAAAILTTGGKHAPLDKCYAFLMKRTLQLTNIGDDLAENDGLAPGWGNDFVKGQADPALTPLHDLIDAHGKEGARLGAQLNLVTAHLHGLGKIIYPNPGCYTAAVGLLLGVPVFVLPFLFILGRLSSWTDLILQNLPKEN